MVRFLLSKATSSSDTPTPGYLYDEIADLTKQGASEKIVNFLTQRLKKDNPNIRLKALLVIKHTCRKGDPSFRRFILASQTCLDIVKACTTYSGKPDPLKGNQPYKAVRDTAKEATEAIYDSSKDESSASKSMLAGRIQGLGSYTEADSVEQAASVKESGASGFSLSGGLASASNLASSALALATATTKNDTSKTSQRGYQNSGSGSRPEKFWGIGNPNFVDPRMKPKGFIDRVRDRLEKFNEHESEKHISSFSNDSAANGWNAPSISSSTYPVTETNSSSSASQQIGLSSQKSRSPGQVGGVWGNSGYRQEIPVSTSTFSNSNSRLNKAGGAESDGKYEKSLVDDLCSREGVRSTPVKEKLREFVSACQTLEAEIVMPFLEEKLHSDDWKVQHKALCVCEALIKSGECEAYTDYLDENAEILEEMLTSNHPSVQNRAKRIWRLLYDEDPDHIERDNAKSGIQVSSSTSHEGNLLDFGIENGDATDSVVSQEKINSDLNSIPVSGTGEGSLFANMNVRARKSTNETEMEKAANNLEDLLIDESNSRSGAENARRGFSFLQGSPSSSSENVQSPQGFDFIGAIPNAAPPTSSVQNVLSPEVDRTKPSAHAIQSNQVKSNAGLENLQATIRQQQEMYQQQQQLMYKQMYGYPQFTQQYNPMGMQRAPYAQQPFPGPYNSQKQPRSYQSTQLKGKAGVAATPIASAVHNKNVQREPDKFDDIVKASMAEM